MRLDNKFIVLTKEGTVTLVDTLEDAFTAAASENIYRILPYESYEEVSKLRDNREMWMGMAVKRKAQLEEVLDDNKYLSEENKRLKDLIKVLNPDWVESDTTKKSSKGQSRVKQGKIKLNKLSNFKYKYSATVYYEIITDLPSNSNVDDIFKKYRNIEEEELLKEFIELAEILPKSYKSITIKELIPSGKNLKMIISVEEKIE